MGREWKLLLLALLLTMGLVACGGGGSTGGTEPEAETGDAEPVAAGDVFKGNCTPEGTLRLWNWSEYMEPELLKEFGDLHGIMVLEDNFSSNEEVLSKLRAGASGYDLIFPSDYAVDIMAEEGLIAELDRSNIPNIANVDPRNMGLYYDPENKVSLPFQWGVTGIGYNTTYFETAPDSWSFVFDPEIAGTQEGFFSILDDEREAIGAALKYLGHSVNDTDPAHIEAARDLLLAQKAFASFSGYNSDNFYDTLAGEEVQYAQSWSGGTALAASQNPDIRFAVPKEGGVIWQDNMAIPTDSTNKCTAELFMNFLLDPQIAARLIDYTFYNTPVLGAEEFMLPETTELLSKGFVPDDETRARLEWIERAGDSTIFSDTWTEIKSR